MRALLDNAEVKLSSKASLAPLEIMKIHRDLFYTLQDAHEGVKVYIHICYTILSKNNLFLRLSIFLIPPTVNPVMDINA